MTVHMIATPPTPAAMAMITVNVVRVILDDDATGAAEVLGDASDAWVVTVTWALVGVAITRGVLTAAMDVREEVDEDKLDDRDDVLEEGRVLELGFVIELRMPLRPKGSLVEDDDEAEAGGVLEKVGVFFEGAGVLDEVGVDSAGVLDADADEDADADAETVSEGGSAAAPSAGLRLLLPPPKSPCGRGARFLIRRLRLT